MELPTEVVVWDTIVRRHPDDLELKVDDLLHTLVQEKRSVGRYTVVQVLKGYEKRGLGRFMVGRHGHPSRMWWCKGKPSSLKPNSTQLLSKTSTVAPNGAGAGTTSSSPLTDYNFPVRDGVFAKLSLPTDLSDAEAARLSQFLHSLALS